MKILIVDDDYELVELLTFALRRAGLEVLGAHDVPSARKRFEGSRPNLVVLDVNLGASDGFELLKEIRRHSEVPVIMLTGRDTENDKVLGLELGADDYVTKPFSHRELIARIRANLRRHEQEGSAPSPAPSVLQVGPINLNATAHTVAKGGQALDLTVTEFRLLHYLMINAGAAVPTRAILKQIWGYDDPEGTEVVRTAIHRLRHKLEDDPARPQFLHTVPRFGFVLKWE